jgi:ABC-2 type transport system permease protein/lipopolysaccharide transport system permease protein
MPHAGSPSASPWGRTPGEGRAGEVHVIVVALKDFRDSVKAWRQWLRMSFTDVVMQYRRSLLGPFWLVLNNMAMIVALGVVYSYVFNVSIGNYIPYFASGLLTWNLLSAFVNEGANTYIGNAAMVRNLNLAPPFLAFKVTSRQFIIFLHNIFVMIPVFIWFPSILSVNNLLALPALALHLVNGVALSILLGMLCARFRDMPNILVNAMQMLFFLTPIFWPASSVSQPLIYQFNPFYHYVEIVRAPLMGDLPAETSWMAAAGLSLVLWIGALITYARYRWRLVHLV